MPQALDVVLLLAFVATAVFVAALAYEEGRRTGARRRAELLMRQLRALEELAQRERCGYLDVPSRGTPGRFYRIPARPDLVTVMEGDGPVVRLCLRPAWTLPDGERVIARRTLLEAPEADYWRRANRRQTRCRW
jgi:hypothetical protein